MTNTDAIATPRYDVTENHGSSPVVVLAEEELLQYCTERNLKLEIMKEMAGGITERRFYRGYTCKIHEETNA